MNNEKYDEKYYTITDAPIGFKRKSVVNNLNDRWYLRSCDCSRKYIVPTIVYEVIFREHTNLPTGVVPFFVI